MAKQKQTKLSDVFLTSTWTNTEYFFIVNYVNISSAFIAVVGMWLINRSNIFSNISHSHRSKFDGKCVVFALVPESAVYLLLFLIEFRFKWMCNWNLFHNRTTTKNHLQLTLAIQHFFPHSYDFYYRKCIIDIINPFVDLH